MVDNGLTTLEAVIWEGDERQGDVRSRLGLSEGVPQALHG